MSLIAPWLRNTLRLRGTAGTIQANYDRTVTTPPAQNVLGSAGQQEARVCRPGAILLANLDIDETGGRARFGAAALDALNDVVDGGDDNAELTLFQVTELNPLPAVTASLINVLIDHADTQRVRAWKIPAANRMRDGGEPAMGLLQGVIHAPGDKVIGHWVKSAPGWTIFYGIEAIALAGDPRAPAPAGPAPHPP
jgi:hypothetical protein